MKRQRLTPKERKRMWKAQQGLCACGCGQSLESGPVDEEHFYCLALGGNRKPDALWLRDCHKKKTAEDRKKIAKVKRILGETRSQWNGTKMRRIWAARSLSNPNFKRKVDGTAVAR